MEYSGVIWTHSQNEYWDSCVTAPGAVTRYRWPTARKGTAGFYIGIASICRTTHLFGSNCCRTTMILRPWATWDEPRHWNCSQGSTTGRRSERMLTVSYEIATPAAGQRRHAMPLMVSYGPCRYQNGPGNTYQSISSLAYRSKGDSMQSVLWWIA